MPLSDLLAQTRPAMELLDVAPKPPVCPSWAIFFSASDSQNRAHIVQGHGDTFDQAWQQGAGALQQWQQQSGADVRWLRVDLVDKVKALRWDTL
ncbi:MAG: Mur ligase, partial [Leclercia adecarboxylata]|nr:Mur ligase [Leclercia adecarboxylata]